MLPTNAGSFETDIEDGLTSSQFDLTANINEEDSRAGLKDKEEIMRIMKKQNVSFDEARLIRQQKLLKKNVSGYQWDTLLIEVLMCCFMCRILILLLVYLWTLNLCPFKLI